MTSNPKEVTKDGNLSGETHYGLDAVEQQGIPVQLFGTEFQRWNSRQRLEVVAGGILVSI
jgi:hypothetical protein